MNLKDLSFSKDWTLFLDRDGVISRRIIGGYITRWEDFKFLDGVLEAIKGFSDIFGRIIVVSNQQGVGKGIMSDESLEIIDNRMKDEIRLAGGRIDESYYSRYLASENHPDRKPGTGMGLKAKVDYPDIDFSKSVMVGDSPSDMEFGKGLGMVTVLITDEDLTDNELADLQFRSLSELSKHF